MSALKMPERQREGLFEDKLLLNGFDKSKLEYQKTKNTILQSVLASKRDDGSPGTDGSGRPEFIYGLTDNFANVILVEVKASVNQHTGLKETDDPDTCSIKAKKYAEDGVINYLRGAKTVANAIGLAVSAYSDGQLRITGFISKKGGPIKRLPITENTILTPQKYLFELQVDQAKLSSKVVEIKKFAGKLHDYLRDSMELGKDEKPLLVSGILLALKTSFRNTYEEYSRARLPKQLISDIKEYFEDSNIPQDKAAAMLREYEHVVYQKNVGENLPELVKMIDHEIGNLIIDGEIGLESYDFLGDFYREFLRYTGGDKQNLGIVLTPHHVCELFCDIADRMGYMNPERDVVTDICTGTAGFLVAAMSRLLQKAKGATTIEERVKRDGLCGVDNKSQMFTIACANMMLRGDGKSNIYHGDVITQLEDYNRMAELKPTVAMLNPPYAKKDDTLHEFAFIEKGLELLAPQKGVCIAIVPMRLAIDDKKANIAWREKILAKHTLEAVMSMPDGLFPEVGVVTCIMVFQAGRPHQDTQQTYFGYWKDDGFELLKGERSDKNGKWSEIKKHWLDDFFGKKSGQVKSAKKNVTYKDEWCVEAYMETDYLNLSPEIFELEIKKFTAFSYLHSISDDYETKECVNG